jgi:hypothetical protein
VAELLDKLPILTTTRDWNHRLCRIEREASEDRGRRIKIFPDAIEGSLEHFGSIFVHDPPHNQNDRLLSQQKALNKGLFVGSILDSNTLPQNAWIEPSRQSFWFLMRIIRMLCRATERTCSIPWIDNAI